MQKITPRSKNYSKWYNDIIIKSNIAEFSNIHGFIIIKPYGFSIWENIKNILDKMLKDSGHKNAYFPLLIPKSYLEKELSHIQGFANESAIVTHYRLKNTKNNKLIIDEKSKLLEELIIRPTSEAIIWKTYKNWINSYRDLPILINQWANVVRWEMKNRFFLRNSEFLWQEGHTAHISKKEAIKENIKILNIYTDLLENFLSIPVFQGIKTENEKFAGAETTFCIESIMQNGKALQIATSHFLGQNFSKSFNVKFTKQSGIQEYVWGTSWGISTRLIGALIMTHADDSGLVLPPLLAPIQVVIIPIYQNDDQLSKITEFILKIEKNLIHQGIRVKFDNINIHRPGWKFHNYEMQGIPIRICIGQKDIQNNTVEIFRRDNLEKQIINTNEICHLIPRLMKKIQINLFNKAKKNIYNNYISYIEDYDEFKYILNKKKGFIFTHWDGTTNTEKKIKQETNATIRFIPLNNNNKDIGKCIYSKKKSSQRVCFAKAY